MIQAIINYDFIKRALILAVFASILSGIIGTIIVKKRLVSMSGGIAHTAFGGVGLGYLLGIEPIVFAIIFGVIASISIPYIQRKIKTKADTLIAIFWSVGMSLGILFIGFMPGYPPDLTSYLFGDILTVSTNYLIFIIILTSVVLFLIFGMFNYIKIYLFDELFLKVMKVKVSILEKIIYIIIAITIVLMIKVVGIILSIALLSIPVSIAEMYSKNLLKTMIYTFLVALFANVCGLVISYYLNIPSGASIIILLGFIYLISFVVKKIAGGKNA